MERERETGGAERIFLYSHFSGGKFQHEFFPGGGARGSYSDKLHILVLCIFCVKFLYGLSVNKVSVELL